MTRPDRVALIHYHLRGGGVARVLEHQQQVLREHDIASVILVGETPPDNIPHENVIVVDGLGYATDDASLMTADFAETVRTRATDALGGAPDLWHIHNHSLGKNIVTPLLTKSLADAGERVLLQMHDFAEDGRPGNYAYLRQHLGDAFASVLYPDAPGVHYAVLNRRDRRFLIDAGASPARVHALPNAVHFDDASLDEAQVPEIDGPLLLYPTRAIARKNLGETLLWSLLDKTFRYGITLAPKNPKERPGYDHWVDLAEELGLPVTFELGLAHSFPGLLKRADSLLTTSIAEGFGLAFLEPLRVGKPLCGRALPEITNEFIEAGVNLSALYSRLDVPLDWIGADRLRNRITFKLTASRNQYGVDCTKAAIESAYRAACDGDAVDFARLDASMQEDVLRKLHADPALCECVRPRRLQESAPDPATLDNNREVVESVWSLEQYATNLCSIYADVLASSGEQSGAPDAGRFLAAFLDPARFYLLRS